MFRFRLVLAGRDISAAGILGPFEAGEESLWIETFDRRITDAQRIHLEAARREMCQRMAGRYPSAEPLAVRTMFLEPGGSYVIDAVLPDV